MSVRGTDAGGFSLVEVVIAMFLLAVLALAVLPALIGATRASVTNRSVLEATTFANGQLAAIQADFPDDPAAPTSCADLRGRAHTPGPPDPQTGLRTEITIGACPAFFPAAIPVAVVVYAEDSADAVVRMPTKVLVSAP